MFLLLSLGCLGTLSIDGDTERLRTALLITGDSEERWLLVANSTVLCEPEESENDPRTPVDEVASAKEFWQAQVVAAQTREGAFVTVVRLPSDSGTFELGPWLVGGPAGGWYHVIEAAVTEREELLTTYLPTELESDLEAVGEVTISPDGERFSGTFAYPDDGIEGTFHAEGCGSQDLLRLATEIQY